MADRSNSGTAGGTSAATHEPQGPANAGGASARATAGAAHEPPGPAADLMFLHPRKPDGPAPTVKTYDFYRPDKFSREQINMVSIIHSDFARRAQAALTTLLRLDCTMDVEAVDQLNFAEFMESTATPTVLGEIAMDPLPGLALLEIEPSIATAVVDRLFGAQPNDLAATEEKVCCSELELDVLGDVALELANHLREAWSPVVGGTFGVPRLETNKQLVPGAPPTSMVVQIVWKVTIGQVTGRIQLGIHQLVLEPVLKRLNVETMFGPEGVAVGSSGPGSGRLSVGSAGQVGDTREQVRGPEAVADLPLTVHVAYPAGSMALADLASLAVATRIPLEGNGRTAELQSGGVTLARLNPTMEPPLEQMVEPTVEPATNRSLQRSEREGTYEVERPERLPLSEREIVDRMFGSEGPAPAKRAAAGPHPTDPAAAITRQVQQSIETTLAPALQEMTEQLRLLNRRQSELMDSVLMGGQPNGGEAATGIDRSRMEPGHLQPSWRQGRQLQAPAGPGQQDPMSGETTLTGIRPSDIDSVLLILRHQRTQVIAMVLSHMEPQTAARVLDKLPSTTRTAVTARIARLDTVASQVVDKTEQYLRDRLNESGVGGVQKPGGIAGVSNILNYTARETEMDVVLSLEKLDADLADEIKHAMFVFEDIVLLDPANVPVIFDEAGLDTMALASRTVEATVKDFIADSLGDERSKAFVDRIAELGRVRLSEVEQAQVAVVEAIRRLDESGLITVVRPPN